MTGSYIITVSHADVLTLLTPASSRISFISPPSEGEVNIIVAAFSEEVVYRTAD